MSETASDALRDTGPLGESTALHLSILTPEDILFEGDVDWIEVPLQDGLLGIWPGHAPLIGALAAGELRYAQGGREQTFAVSDGVLRVSVERCAVLLSRDASSAPAAEDLGTQLVDAIDQDLGAEVVESLSAEPPATADGGDAS